MAIYRNKTHPRLCFRPPGAPRIAVARRGSSQRLLCPSAEVIHSSSDTPISPRLPNSQYRWKRNDGHSFLPVSLALGPPRRRLPLPPVLPPFPVYAISPRPLPPSPSAPRAPSLCPQSDNECYGALHSAPVPRGCREAASLRASHRLGVARVPAMTWPWPCSHNTRYRTAPATWLPSPTWLPPHCPVRTRCCSRADNEGVRGAVVAFTATAAARLAPQRPPPGVAPVIGRCGTPRARLQPSTDL